MTLPASGPLLASMINVELGRNFNALFRLNGAQERALAGVPAGQVNFTDFYGKSRGFPTPSEDYPQPVQIDTVTPYPGAFVFVIASIVFEADGVLTISSTSTQPFPPRWYQGGTPPTSYQILISLLGSVRQGAPGEIVASISNVDTWQSVVNSPSASLKVANSVPPSEATGVSAVYGVQISDGSKVVASFNFAINAQITYP